MTLTLSWMGGVYYYESRRDLEEQHFLATAPTVDSGESRVDNVAAFGSLGYNITDRWDVTAELRFARDTVGNYNAVRTPPLSEDEYDTWSPRITSSYKITPETTVYLNVAEGNKPGVINADPRFPASIRLADPESAWTYEIGTKNSLMDGRLTVNVAAYYIDWTDQQITTAFTFPGGGTQSYITNAAKSEIKGLELELTGMVTDNLTAGLTYAYTDAEFKELVDSEAGQLFGNTSLAGNSLFGVPKHQGSVFGKYSFPMGSWGNGYIRADASYTSKKYAQIYNLVNTGAQELLNLSFGVDTDHWGAQLFIKNLTDDRTPSSVTRYVDQLNLNVPQFTNANPAQDNVPGSTTLERAFFLPLAAKRQVGVNLTYSF